MNNNKKKKTLKQLKAAMICGAFLLLLGASIHMLILETRAHAAYINTNATITTTADPILGLDDPTPTPTPDNPTPTPTPGLPPIIPPLKTPTPTSTPKPTPTPKPKPTQVPIQPTMPVFQPTPTIEVGGMIPPDPMSTITATPPTKPKPTPNATSTTSTDTTPTAVPATGSSNTTTPTDDPTPKAAGGMSPLVKSIAIGSAIAILASILLGIFFLKRPKGTKPIPYRTYSQSLAQTAQPTPWLNQANADAAFVTPGGDRLGLANDQAQAIASANSMPANQPKANTPPPISSFTGPQRAIPMPSHTQKQKAVAATPAPALIASMAQAAIDAQPYLKSNNPRPMAAPMGAAFTQKNPVSTSDMNPFPLDNLDLSNMLPQTNRRNDSLWDAPVTTSNKNSPPAAPLTAPSIQDDPILETIMRQAQMGIYAIADKSPSNSSDEIDDAFLG